MLRKDLCHWTTGIQIRRNLATVEEWAQKRGLATLLNARFVEVTQVRDFTASVTMFLPCMHACCYESVASGWFQPLTRLVCMVPDGIQVSQLLQVNKTSSADLELICETCTKLQSLQVQKILSM